MGKTATGTKILRAFKKEYGPKRGERVFYAYATRHHNSTPHGKHRLLTGRAGRVASRGARTPIKRRR